MIANANVKSMIAIVLVVLPGLVVKPAAGTKTKEQIDAENLNNKQQIKAYCIDFNWGPGGPNAFTAPGIWSDANPKEHVKWYKSIGANVIQTFAVSCNGYAWYKNGVVPEQPGLKYDFLTEMVRLGHKENMKVMGYFCIGANVRWGQLYPDESYGLPADGHIPLTRKYNQYLAGAIKDALKKTDMDGFMIDWLFHGSIHNTQIQWLPCEIEMWAELMDGSFPGKDKVTNAQEMEFARRSVDRCWQSIKIAAKSTKPDCIIWLSLYNLNHPQVVNSRVIKEVDWLMNEGGTPEELEKIRKKLGRGNLINCLAAWNKADPRTVVPASIEAGFGLYGFTKPVKGNLLPSIDDYYLAKDIDELTGDEANIAMLARAYRGLSLPSVLNSGIHIIPRPATLDVKEGSFKLTSETRILADAQSVNTAEQLSEMLRYDSGLTLKVSSLKKDKPAKGAIVLTTQNARSRLGDEGYELTVSPDGIVIRGPKAAGVYYGAQTLRQLLGADKGRRKTINIPCVVIKDKPRFGWRGYMLDSSRHFQDAAFVKKTLDTMAFHKLNTFHWHIVDDHGWRLEIKKYPKLTEIGAWRNQPGYDDGNGGNIYGGFYTQDEIREVVAYAKERHITIVPEIEMPGHSRAAIASYYELSCDSFPPTVVDYFFDFPHNGKGWPNHKGSNVLCAGKEFTFEFLENVLTEVLELFPSEFIHIGGDEASKAFWSKCKYCQHRKTTEKLSNEHELQSYFIKRMEKYLNSKGRRLIGWNEILEGGLAPNATVMSWQGTHGGVIAARAGHDVVMSPQEFIYFDHPESNAPGYPMSWGSGISSLETVYNYEPIPSELTASQSKHVLGAQANMWTVYTHTDESIEFMTYPRLCALAEITWTSRDNRNWQNFQSRMETHFNRLDALGVTNFRDPTVRIGKWKSAEMSETYKSISYDITDILKKEGAGKYDVHFQYTGGAHMLRIEWTAIYQGQTQLSRDEHPGFTGASHENNTYHLDIKTLSPGKKYTLTALVRSDGGTDSNGYISIRKAPE